MVPTWPTAAAFFVLINVINLANVAMSTTVIGAMNSSVTRLGANLSTPVVVK